MTAADVPSSAAGRRDKSAISSPYLHGLQLRHFLLFDILPFLLTVVAIGLLFVRPLGKADIGLFLFMWLATGLGLTVGYHRLFSHRAFATGAAVSVGLLILGSMAGRGPMISWVAMHRRHHECSDREGDLHSPNMHGSTPVRRLADGCMRTGRGWYGTIIQTLRGTFPTCCAIKRCSRPTVTTMFGSRSACCFPRSQEACSR